LPHRKDLLQIGLGFLEVRLAGLARLNQLGERRLGFGTRRFGIHCTLQAFSLRAGLAKHSSLTATTAASTLIATAAIIATASRTAEKSTHALANYGLLGVHDFLDKRLDCIPLGVVGDFHFGFDPIHHHLLALSGIHIPPLPAAAALASTLTAVAIILRQHAAGSQTHQRS
jgi:hypothetical protein